MRVLAPASASARELPRDDQALDLARALVDLQELGVAHQLLDRVVPDVAVAAEDLDRVDGRLHGAVRAVDLGVAGHDRIADAGVQVPGGLLVEQARGFDADGHVREHGLHHLVLGDGDAEGLAILGVGDALVEAALHEPGGQRADVRAGLVEGLHRELEAFALGCEQVLLGHHHVLEVHDAGIAGALAQLVLVLVDLEPGRVAVDDEGRDALVALGRVAGGEDHEEAGEAGVGDPGLLPVEHVVVAALFEFGAHARHVAAGAGLGGGVGGEDGIRGEHPEVLLLLRVVAGQLDRRERQRIGQHAGRDPGATPGELLGDHGVLELAHARTAVLWRNGHVDQAELVRGHHHLGGEAALVIAGRGDGRDALPREAFGGFDQRLVFIG